MTRVRLALTAILLMAGLLRFYGLGWGTDPETGQFHAFHPDETQVIQNSRHIGVDLHQILSSYGKAPMMLYAAVARTAGWLGGFDPYDFDDNNTMRRAYLTGRTLSAILGSLTVGIVFAIGSRMGGAPLGLLAALLLAFCTGHIQQSHYYTIDVFLAFWVSLSLLLMLRMPSPSIWIYLLCGLATGMAASTRFVGAGVGLAFGIAHLWPATSMYRWRPDWRALYTPAIGVYLLIFLAVVLACEPLLIDDPSHLLQQGTSRTLMTAIGEARGDIARIWGLYDFSTTPYLFYITNLLRHAMGSPLEIAALVGLVWAAFRMDRTAWIMLGWLIPYFAVVAGLHTKPIRYATPMLPPLAVFAAWACVAAGERLRARWNRTLLNALPALLVALPTMAYAAAFTNVYRQWDSRFLAQKWIQQHIPKGDGVLVERGAFDTSWLVPESHYRPTTLGAQYFVAVDGYVPYGAMVDYVEKKLDGVQWIVMIEENRSRHFREVPRRYPVGYRLYEDLAMERLGFRREAVFKVSPGFLGATIDEGASDPTFTGFDHPTVVVHRRVGSSAERLQVWRESLSAAEGLPDRYVQTGFAAYEAGEYDTAESEFLKAISRRDHFPLGHMLLKEVYQKQGRVASANLQLQLAAAGSGAGPRSPELAEGLIKVGMEQEGLALLESLLVDDGGKVEGLDLERVKEVLVFALLDVGKQYYYDGKPELAVDYFRRAVAWGPERYAPNFGLGVLLYERQESEAAVASFRKAVEITPTS